MRVLVAFILLATTLMFASCDWALQTGCAGVGYSAVRVAIRDEAGNPQAFDATVTLTDGAYREQDSSRYDPLNIDAANDRGGRTYDILVTKRYYKEVSVRGVHAPGGGCVTGHESKPVTVTVPITLSVAPGAPAVRSVHLFPPHILLDRSPYPSVGMFTPYVDANAGMSHAVYWRISGDTASVIFHPVTGTLRYRCLSTSGKITITALAMADSSVVGLADVAVQGHPAAAADPPCS